METCSSLIQTDKFEGSSRLTDYFSFLSFVNEENYEFTKENAAAEYKGYGIFNGDYESFKEKKKKLTTLLSTFGYRDQENNYRHHIFSKASAEAYANCLRENSNALIAVWVEGKTDSQIAIKVRTGASGNSTVEFYLNENQEKKYTLLSNSDMTIVLDYNPKFDLMVTVNATRLETKESKSHTITIPRVRNLKIVPVRKELFGHIDIGAGGYGSQEKNTYTTHFTFVADPDYDLLPDTFAEYDRKMTGVRPLLSYKFNKVIEGVEDNDINRVTISATNLVGSHKDQQSNERIFIRMFQEKDMIVEE